MAIYCDAHGAIAINNFGAASQRDREINGGYPITLNALFCECHGIVQCNVDPMK